MVPAAATISCRGPREADTLSFPTEWADSVVSTGMAAIGMIIIITTTMTLIISSSLVASPSGGGAGGGGIHIMATIRPTAITHTVTMAAAITVPAMAATDTVIDQELLECSDSSLVRDTIMVPSTESWAL